jgi:DNA-binding protein YbaB
MVKLPAPPQEPPFDEGKVGDVLQKFVDLGSRGFEAKVDDLVRVRVSGSMSVLAVELLDPALDPGMKQRLETAIASAVNTAQQRAALAASQALSEFAQQKKTGKTSA